MAGASLLYKFNQWKAERRLASLLVFGSCLAASLLLCSCATPYQPLRHRYGYADRHVTNGVYEVSFLGNASTSYERASDFALLRAAEIALKHHAKSFILLDVVNLGSAHPYLTPPLFYWTTAAGLDAAGQNPPSVAALLDWTEGSYLVMEPAQERTYYRPGVGLKVKLLPDPPGAYYPDDPAQVIQRLERKYRIKVGRG
jgi:hypothetical protein